MQELHQSDKGKQASEFLGPKLPGTSEHIPEDKGQPLIPLEMINSTSVSSSLPEQSTPILLQDGVEENVSESMQSFKVCITPLLSTSSTVSSTSTTISKTVPTPDLESPENILQSCSLLDGFPVCTSPLSSTSTTVSKTVSAPGNILQSCSKFDGFPVVSSVFSLQGVQPTASAAAEPKRTKTPTGEHSKKESQSIGKKKMDVTSIKPMSAVSVSSLKLHERQQSALHECTLLTFILEAQGGFFKGKQFTMTGLKAIFATLQSHRCELTFQELTKMCYSLFAIEMKKLERSKFKAFLEVLDSFLYLFNWYCHKNWPVFTVAMCIYLSDAADYSSYTWHGMCPTGWSEYCCVVIMREVMQFVLDNAKTSPILPPYSPDYFSSPSSYTSNLLPRSLPSAQNLSDGTPCGSPASCSSANQASKVSKGSCTEDTGTVEACSTEDPATVRNAITPQPSQNLPLQTSAARYIKILPKVYSNPGSANKQFVADKVTSKDCAVTTDCDFGLKDLKDVVSCRKDIDTETPEDVSVDGNCHNSSSSSRNTDANSIDETPCLHDVNVAVTTTKTQEVLTAADEKNTDKTRKRGYFTCFIDESNEEQNDNHIKIRIKKSKHDLDSSDPEEITLRCTENDIKDRLENQSLPSDDKPIDSLEADQKTNDDATSLGDQQKDRDGREEMKVGEGNSKLDESSAQKVADVRCDKTESDVMMVKSQVTSDSEDKGHVIETSRITTNGMPEEELDNVISQLLQETANHEAPSATKVQSPSSKEVLTSHCMDSNDIKGSTSRVICKRSRLFDALWSNRTPREPRIHMASGSCMSLSEFLERYPLAVTRITRGTAAIEIDNDKYDTYEVLDHFYTGVCFHCNNPSLLGKRSKICYSLAMVDESFFITYVKPISRSTIKTVTSRRIKKSLSLAPYQKIYEDMSLEKTFTANKSVNTEVTIKTHDKCNRADGKTTGTSSNLQGNQSAQEQSEGRALLQQIENLRKTATFLNELASGLEARLITQYE